MCLESIFCGVPVVAFDVGGTRDIVVHKETGWLANPYKVDDLVAGIEWCIKNERNLSSKCIEKAKNDFDAENTVKKYINLFTEILS